MRCAVGPNGTHPVTKTRHLFFTIMAITYGVLLIFIDKLKSRNQVSSDLTGAVVPRMARDELSLGSHCSFPNLLPLVKHNQWHLH